MTRKDGQIRARSWRILLGLLPKLSHYAKCKDPAKRLILDKKTFLFNILPIRVQSPSAMRRRCRAKGPPCAIFPEVIGICAK
jgi:hypothetical protein